MDQKFFWRKLLGAVLVLGLIGIFWLPLKIPVQWPAMVVWQPARAWEVMAHADGSLSAWEVDLVRGVRKLDQRFLPERGDVVRVHLSDSLATRQWVEAGSRVLWVSSQVLDQAIAELEARVVLARARLEVERTGAKMPLQQAAREALELARTEKELADRQLRRARALFADSLLAAAELEVAEQTAAAAQQRLELAMARLEDAATGEKPELLSFTQHEIRQLERQLHRLRAQRKALAWHTPLAGAWMERTDAAGATIWSVADTSTWVLRAGLPARANWQPRVGDTVHLDFHNRGVVVKAVVLPQPPTSSNAPDDTRWWWYLEPVNQAGRQGAPTWEPAWVVPDSLSLFQYIRRTPLSSQ